ncbi:MAG: thymidine phosphorylase, partial [Verrucomicrobiota bacterium]|nr:thymidine phosphorylase [Verrucomicrobiota bacterium]
FARMVCALGGPGDLLERAASHLPLGPVVLEARPAQSGTVTAIDTRELGLIIVRLGGGRTDPGQGIDHRVGLGQVAALGEEVGSDRPLAVVHAASEEDAQRAGGEVCAAFTVGAGAPEAFAVIHQRVMAG